MSREPLDPHHDHCYVCGPANPGSTGVLFDADGDVLVGELVLDDRHQGVPGLAHGGAIAALLDEAAGSVLLRVGLRFVTARLDVEYLSPVIIGQPLTLRAWLGQVDGRRHHVTAELRAEDLAARASATFVTVSADHFRSRGVEEGALELFGP